MKTIAIIFSCPPYGHNIRKEGLNFVLSASCYTDNINIFFIGDGIFQVIENKNPILQSSKKYVSAFNILTLYNNNFYICYQSLIERGLNKDIKMIIKANIIDYKIIRDKIEKCHHILNF